MNKQITPTKLNKDSAYILGVLMGDGCLSRFSKTSKLRFELGTTDIEFALAFDEAWYKTFKNKLNWNENYRECVTPTGHNYKCYYYRLISNNQKICNYLFQFKNTTQDWQVPEQIKNSTNEIKVGFIQGLFDSEGDVTFSKKQGKYYYPRTRFTSINKEATLELQALMKSVGVNSYINHDASNTRVNPKYFPTTRIIISGTTRNLAFAEKIGFRIGKKQNKLLNYLAIKGAAVHA